MELKKNLQVKLLVILILQSSFSWCQPRLVNAKKVPTRFFNTQNGLSHNNVNAVIKSGDGFMWIGTDDGLNRFDGYTFTHYYHTNKDSASISNDVIRKILIDSKGRLWVGTYNGLNLFDDSSEKFTTFLHDPNNPNTISQNTILCLMEDKNQQLWVGTYWGLNKIDLNTLKITRYNYHEDGTGLPDNAINALLEDRQGNIWVCTSKGIAILNSEGVKSKIIPNGKPDGLPAEIIIDAVQAREGSIYFATNGSGLLYLDNESDRSFDRYARIKNLSGEVLNYSVLGSLALSANNSILVGTNGSGFLEYDSTKQFRKIVDTETKALDLLSIQEIYIDDNGNYWLGSWGAGLILISGSPPRFEHYRHLDDEMAKTNKNSILAIVEDHDKKVWIGTDGAGLYKFDPTTKSFTSYKHAASNVNSLSSDVVKSLLVDSHNNLYIGTFAGGLNYLDTKTSTFTRFLHDPENKNSISTNHVWSLLQSREGRIFVGQLGGFDEFMPESKKFKNLNIGSKVGVNPNTASVFALEEDRNGAIWIGTRLAGIHKFNPGTNTFESFTYASNDSASFPSNEILSLSQDSNGNLLVCTDDKGFFRFDPVHLSCTPILNEFDEKNITSVVEDSQSRLWFTSFDGLHQYNPVTKLVQGFTDADQMQGLQFNEGAVLQSSDGIIYFGGTNGLNVFNPNSVKDDESRPKVVFTKLSLYHDKINVKDKTGILPISINKLKSVTFQPEQNAFTIEFASLDYRFPKKNHYQYLLEGFDNQWNDVGENRLATYTNIPPGDYTLKVMTTNNDGFWNTEYAQIQIIIVPRWYQRKSVQIASVILLLVGFFSIVYMRTSFLSSQNKKLENMVIDRTSIIEKQKAEINGQKEKLEQAYEEVNSTNEELQKVNATLERRVEDRTFELQSAISKLLKTESILTTFLYRASHDLRGPVSSLQGLLNLAKTNKNLDECAVYINNMEKTSNGMLQLLKRLTEISNLFGFSPKLENVDINRVFGLTQNQLMNIDGFEFTRVEFIDRVNVQIKSDEAFLVHIISNVMGNGIVFKSHVNNSFVRCVVSNTSDAIAIQITDNGIGIPSATLPRVFDMFYRGNEKSMGNGLGLFITKLCVDLLGGSIEILSEEEVGTTVEIKIPNKL